MSVKRWNNKKSSFYILEASLKTLVRWEKDYSYVNLLLLTFLKDLKCKERSSAIRMIYGTIQRLNSLDWVLEQFLNKRVSKLTPWIRNILRMGVYQLLYQDHVPFPLVVDVSVQLAHQYGHRGVASLVNGVLRNLSRSKENLPWPEYRDDPVKHISIVNSHPYWLVERWVNRLGLESAEAICKSNNLVPPISVRINTLMGNREGIKKILQQEGLHVEESSTLPVALTMRPGMPLNELSSFQKGYFTVQGEASMFCSFLLNPSPGSQVVDVCSAPGGKATHLAEMMENTGIVHAGEIHSHRLRLVEKAFRRLGLKNYRLHPWDGREVFRHVHQVDKVICDAPCSGLGVIGLKPDLKWRKTPEQLSALSKLQYELLSASSEVVKPGGKLLYSVCSLEPEETREIVEAFLKKHKQFTPADPPHLPFSMKGVWEDPGVLSLYPHRHANEGFYMALLKRRP